MNVYWISAGRIEPRAVDELGTLLTRPDGFTWVDLLAGEDHSTALLSDLFHFHSLAVRDCRDRSLLPKIHAYADHVFVILHTPEPGLAGHIHLLELDQFVGRSYLVTVHAPLGEGVPVKAALRETRAVRERIASGRFQPVSPFELSYAIVSTQTRYMETTVAGMARKVAVFERRVMGGKLENSEQTVEQIFLLRHELLTIRTIAAQSREIVARMFTLAPRVMPPEGRALVEDLLDQYDRVRSLCDGEMAFLQGVIDFYQVRTATKMNIAMERLTLLSALLLPITAVASLYGMNILVFEQTSLLHLGVVITVISLMIAVLFQWAKRQGWW